MNVSIKFLSDDRIGFIGKAIACRDTSPSKIYSTLQRLITYEQKEAAIDIDLLLTRSQKKKHTIGEFLYDNIGDLLSPNVVGQHNDLKPDNVTNEDVVGCFIIGLYEGTQLKLHLWGESLRFPGSMNDKEQKALVQSLLQDRSNYDFESVINHFVSPPIEYFLDLVRGLTSQVYSDTNNNFL